MSYFFSKKLPIDGSDEDSSNHSDKATKDTVSIKINYFI